MSKLDDLHTLVRLLKEFELPVSPILEYAIKEKEAELCIMNEAQTNSESEQIDDLLVSKEPVTFLSIKERFRSYLYSVKSERTARDSYSLIDGRIRYYINKLIDSEADTVYSYKTVGEFMVCLSKLNNDEGYTEDNLRRHHKLSAALASYLDFLTKNDI